MRFIYNTKIFYISKPSCIGEEVGRIKGTFVCILPGDRLS